MVEFQVKCKEEERLETGLHFGHLACGEPRLCPTYPAWTVPGLSQ